MWCSYLIATSLALLSIESITAAPQGSLPLSREGKSLNLDFEDGTLRDWTASGDAFNGQPVKGDSVGARRADMHSQHQGNSWIGTFEKAGDKPKGTLTSIPFPVTQPFAAFLVGGGSHAGTRVELATAGDKKVFFKCSGADSENLRPVVVDLGQVQGKEIFIRLVDEESGGWGHLNFDDFRFYKERPRFADEFKPMAAAKSTELPPIDVLKFAGLAPEQAAREMTLPPGFSATLFAGEPDVKQPIAFALDDRGRLWVAEAYTYPIRAAEGQGKDRILVFEDTNGDGKFDRRTVFMEDLNLVSALEFGFGGVWVGAAPYLMFIPIKDGDAPQPAGKPQILLDGWAYQDTHETLNTFTWGPDGWLYGCQGVFTHSNVGKPGSKDSERTKINAGVWRYHPTRHVFELFAEGTSNPWGIDFDEHGQCIVEACVIPHLFHMIQGGRFQRQANSHFNPYIYDDIKTFADHVHWVGDKDRPHAGNSRSGAAGGGHAHAGLLIYQETQWPEQFYGRLFMNNIHGACINMDVPERSGSGFVGHHAPNFIEFNDTWSQIINLRSGPDGSVYMIDWYDKNQCHHNDPNGHDRTNGRIFKVRYNGGPDNKNGHAQQDLAQASDAELLEIQIRKAGVHDGDTWQARHARRLLQERAAAGKLQPDTFKAAASFARREPEENQQLRLLWATQDVGLLDEAGASSLLPSPHEYVRAWAVQFLCESNTPSSEIMTTFAQMARSDRSPVVRLYLASALQKLPLEPRWQIVENLAHRDEDAKDRNLPLMIWYGLEPLCALDSQRSLTIASSSKLPNLLNFAVRRCAAANMPASMRAITSLLENVLDEAKQLEALRGLSFAMQGRRSAPMPDGWDRVEAKLGSSADVEVKSLTQALSMTFGSPGAVASLKKTVMDKSAPLSARRSACDALLAAHAVGLAPLLQELLTDKELQGPALRGLAAYEDNKTSAAILNVYGSLDGTHRRDALNTLAARVVSAKAMLAAMKEGQVPGKDVTAEVVRQLRNLKDPLVDQEVQSVWGVMRDSAADKQKEIGHYKQVFAAGGSQPGDASRGRAVYARTCQQCHTLFEVGGKVGPDLTGSNRGDLDYLLQNIVDPNAVIPNDYKAWSVETTDDRSLTGLLKQQDAKSVTLVTANETLIIPRNEIKTLKEGALSMMPEGLLQTLNDQEVRDLIYYLRGPAQAPLLATPETAATFFNGKDLSGWEGAPGLWTVESGEIVGRTASGLKHNEFLKSQLVAEDFRLTLKIKLTPNKENSGVQFRSERFGDYEMRGLQADAGAGWWGKLYEENGRALLWDKSGEPWVKPDDWNAYEIVASGNRVRTYLNGQLCVDIQDPKISRRGIFGLQMHAGGPLEVRFKDIRLELNPKLDEAAGK
jgi:putative membrane-bound dehydrogenase-like protein